MARRVVSPKGPHEPRRLQATGAILDAATELLAEFGVHGFSIADVSARCGRPPAAIIHYYKSRVGLLVAVTERLVCDRLQPFDQSDGRTLAASLRAVVADAIKNPGRARAMATLECSAALPSEVQSLVDGARQAWHGALCARIGAERGRARAADDAETAAEASLIAFALSGIVLSARAPNDLQSSCERLVAAISPPDVAVSAPAKKRKAGAVGTASTPPPIQGTLF